MQVLQLLHFNNILHYSQYYNCSISIISCTMQVQPLLHFNNILHYAQ